MGSFFKYDFTFSITFTFSFSINGGKCRKKFRYSLRISSFEQRGKAGRWGGERWGEIARRIVGRHVTGWFAILLQISTICSKFFQVQTLLLNFARHCLCNKSLKLKIHRLSFACSYFEKLRVTLNSKDPRYT